MKTKKGETLSASKVVLCTGAFTAKLLEQAAKASNKPNISAGGRIIAGGITTGMTKLDEESYKRFEHMPVAVQSYNATTGEHFLILATLASYTGS